MIALQRLRDAGYTYDWSVTVRQMAVTLVWPQPPGPTASRLRCDPLAVCLAARR